jgi:hypothetical protein
MSAVRYVSDDEDSDRWCGFEFRPGDIVISTRSKHGTTWVQMICALLVFQAPDLPAPLWELSPWLDWLVEPREEVVARLEAQRHRRFIKTHTPLDGVPLDDRATYVVVARNPLDAAVSLYHQAANLDRERLEQLMGRRPPARPRPPLDAGLSAWIEAGADPLQELDSLPGVLRHLTDAWERRAQPNVVLVHFDDLVEDLDGEMRRLAARVAIDVPDAAWPGLVHAAGFDAMRERADDLAPGRGVLIDPMAFFRRGSSGAAADVLGRTGLARYQARAAALAPPDLLAWLHRDPPRSEGQARSEGSPSR